MNDAPTIEYHRLALLRIVATLFAAAGMTPGGGSVATLPKPVRLWIARMLLPAETAFRRLVVYLARYIKRPLRRPRTGASPKTAARIGERAACFGLFDRRKAYEGLSTSAPRPKPGAGPGIWLFDGRDPVWEPKSDKPARDPDDARRLCRRLQALRQALQDVPRQARRLLRALEKRAEAPPGPKRMGPIRPGFPPGYRQSRPREVDEILYECHMMALQDRPPDTS